MNAPNTIGLRAYDLATELESAPKVEARRESERTPADYAIEHGEYLAVAADGYIKAVNAYDNEAADGDGLGIQTALEVRTDHYKALQIAIYEFRKRAERATPCMKPSKED